VQDDTDIKLLLPPSHHHGKFIVALCEQQQQSERRNKGNVSFFLGVGIPTGAFKAHADVT